MCSIYIYIDWLIKLSLFCLNTHETCKIYTYTIYWLVKPPLLRSNRYYINRHSIIYIYICIYIIHVSIYIYIYIYIYTCMAEINPSLFGIHSLSFSHWRWPTRSSASARRCREASTAKRWASLRVGGARTVKSGAEPQETMVKCGEFHM